MVKKKFMTNKEYTSMSGVACKASKIEEYWKCKLSSNNPWMPAENYYDISSEFKGMWKLY